MNSRIHRRLAGLALFAALLSGLAPSLSRLFAEPHGATLTELCTPHGLKQVALDDGAGKHPGDPALGDDCCRYCLLLHHSPFLPSAAALHVAMVRHAAAPVPVFHETSLHGRKAGDLHPIRGPPALS